MPHDTAGKRLQAARQATGMSLGRAWVRVEVALGPLAISDQQIRNYELDKVAEEHWNPLVIQVLADTYGVEVEDISIAAAEAMDRVRALAFRDPDREFKSRGIWTPRHKRARGGTHPDFRKAGRDKTRPDPRMLEMLDALAVGDVRTPR